MTATVHHLRPRANTPVTANRAPIPRAFNEFSPVSQVVESHLFADLDSYADRLDRAAIIDMVERWKKQA